MTFPLNVGEYSAVRDVVAEIKLREKKRKAGQLLADMVSREGYAVSKGRKEQEDVALGLVGTELETGTPTVICRVLATASGTREHVDAWSANILEIYDPVISFRKNIEQPNRRLLTFRVVERDVSLNMRSL